MMMSDLNNIYTKVLLFIILVNIDICLSQYNKAWNDKHENNRCPKLYPKNFINAAPVGNLTAGNYTEKTELKGLRQCVMACCLAESCNIVFIFDGRCFHVECISNELCVPLGRAGNRKWDSHVSMILVKPVLPNESWLDILEQYSNRDVNNFVPEDEPIYSPYANPHRDLLSDDNDSNYQSQFLSNLPNIEDEDNSRGYEKYQDNDNDMIMDASTFLEKVPCEIGSNDDCPINAECIPLSLKTRNGICKCMTGTEENERGACVQTMRPYSKGPTDLDINKSEAVAADSKIDSMAPVAIQHLTVSIVSKEVQLPDNEVTLDVFTIPDEKATGNHYNYVWTLVDQPKGGFTALDFSQCSIFSCGSHCDLQSACQAWILWLYPSLEEACVLLCTDMYRRHDDNILKTNGNMKQNGASVTLTDLTEGQYQFKVTVNGTTAFGVGYGNVTVMPPHRTNKPPQVVITPMVQTVKLPNSVAVLDGSASKDDDAIISWHWELKAGPLGYQPPLQDGPTLMLNDLKQPGNYTFQLTVEDSDHVKNSTTANITVLNHTDYPPEANAGQDVIIYLPNNNLTLNGSLSTDDHEITSWEWTKAGQDENKAVDMQNTHSPFLQLSNLSEGMYTFALKVTDSSGQSSTAEVHVFVKPPTNTPPVALAGPDAFISLPQTWVTLNGSASRDDHRIVAYTWRCLSGPTNATILRYNESVANATSLTKGQYLFSLTVLDDNGNSATDNVTVTVTQNKNSPPRADAGGDQILSLPLPVLTLNGSRSSDDFRIVAWRWTRAASGLAAGTVVLNSDTQPVLMLTNIEPGRYVFELTVTDDQGESSHDTVSVQVKADPLEMNLLEMTLNVPVATFTQSQLDSLVQKMALLLKEDIKVNVTEVRGEIDTGNTQLIFFLSEENKAVEGTRALSLVWSLGTRGYGAAVTRLRPVRCLSTCSGRGVCEQATRACRCDAFWMQSLFTRWRPGAQPDCEWSVVYLSLCGVAALCAACGGVSACARAARRVPPARRPPARVPAYRLLPRADPEDKPFTSKDLSETETDSDVLFESKSKTTSFNRLLNGDLPNSSWKKNGHYKNSRKVKT